MMADTSLRILLVDDNPDDRALVARAIRQVLPAAEVGEAGDQAGFESSFDPARWDVVVTDFQLRWSTGLQVLRYVRERAPDLPVLMFTASGNEEVAVEAMKEGLDDYITKTPKHYARVPYALRAAAERARQRTEQARLASERDAALARLQLADRQKDEFLATLAHELRNPLAPIRYASRLLRPGMSEPDIERLRGMLERQSAHMARLLDDLLDVSRITRGAVVLQRQAFDLRRAVELALEMNRPGITALGHALQVDLPEQAVTIVGDEARLAQVVGNLLQNAAKFTDAPGALHLRLEQEAGQAVLRMRDNGIGIPPERQSELFTLFSQLHRDLANTRGGLGIGLSLVKKLVELHGGTVAVSSAGPGTGAEFVVRLPLAEAAAA